MWRVYLAAVAVLSVIGFVMVGLDKRRAARQRWRIPESSLHLIELLGGFPGTLIARAVFRHKTRKLRYRLIAALMVAAHLGAILFAWRLLY